MTQAKRGIALLLSLILGMGVISGCSKGKRKGSAPANSKTDIEIRYWNSGLGTDWLDALIEAFEDECPEYHVTYLPSADAGAVSSTFGMPDVDTTDLYFCTKRSESAHLESLEDVLDSTPEGESKTIREKLNASYLRSEQYAGGKLYNLSFGGGITGFVYNEDIFKEAGIKQLPRTTDELAVVCDALNKKGITPLCHFREGGYYSYISEVFFAQYSGLDYYYNTFYQCKDESGDTLSKELFTKKDGRYAALKAYEKFITPKYVLAGSNSSTHTNVQTEFIHGNCAMMVNGSWMSNEMESVGSSDKFKTMRMPVVSSITDNLTTITKESELRKVIDAIDSVYDGMKKAEDYKQGEQYVIDGLTVSAEDWTKVADARMSMASNASGNAAFIPDYSNAKEGAKKFLKFMYSDKGHEVYAKALHMVLPFATDSMDIDVSDWNGFEQSQYNLMKGTQNFISSYSSNRHAIFTAGGASAFPVLEYIASFCTQNEAERKNADEIWDMLATNVEQNYEKSWLANIK